MENSKNKILSALKESDSLESTQRALIDFITQNASTDLGDCFDQVEHALVQEKVYEYCKVVIDELTKEQAFEEGDSFEDLGNDCAHFVAFLGEVVSIVNMYSTKLLKFLTKHTFRSIQLLHDTLLALNDCIEGALSFKKIVSAICEHWWINEIAGAEHLLTQLFPYLIITSFAPHATDSDIKRVYHSRKALLLFDLSDESIQSTVALLMRCFISPLYLKVAEGRRFLSFVLSINEGVMHDLIIELMKSQMAGGNKSVCSAFGDLLLKAWRDSSSVDQASNHVEESVQSFIFDAIHAPSRKHFICSRMVISAFHDLKRNREIGALLLRIYAPILWRSLRSANAVVRSQAATLFFDVFPLQHAKGNTEENDNLLQKQFDLLTALLKDPDHRVRAVAGSGACHILREFWEALPPQTIRDILQFLIGSLALDVSSATVRFAVISGVAETLDQPLSHSLLTNLLPLLRNAIHDKSEKVRVAFIRLLVKVKAIRGIHYYDIVPVTHLLHRLANDSNSPGVCDAMCTLMMNSFFPLADQDGNSSSHLQVERCVVFVQQNLPAAEAFYSSIYRHTSVGAVSKFAVVLFQVISSTLEEVDHAASTQSPSKDSSLTLALQLLRILSVLVSSVRLKLKSSKYSSSLKLMGKYFTAEAIAALIQFVRLNNTSAVYRDMLVVVLRFVTQLRNLTREWDISLESTTLAAIGALDDRDASPYLTSAVAELVCRNENDLLSLFDATSAEEEKPSIFHHSKSRSSLTSLITASCEAPWPLYFVSVDDGRIRSQLNTLFASSLAGIFSESDYAVQILKWIGAWAVWSCKLSILSKQDLALDGLLKQEISWICDHEVQMGPVLTVQAALIITIVVSDYARMGMPAALAMSEVEKCWDIISSHGDKLNCELSSQVSIARKRLVSLSAQKLKGNRAFARSDRVIF